MSKLHVFGCSVTQGFALPDVVKPILHSDGTPLTDQEIQDDPTIHWGDIHLYQPSDFAWLQVLADQWNTIIKDLYPVSWEALREND